MSSEIHVVAIITPVAGKEPRLREVLQSLAENVQKNEPGVLKYQFFEQYNSASGTNVFVVEETYKDEEAQVAHGSTDHFAEAKKVLGGEGLLGAPMDVKTIKPVFGFSSR
ncbi:hypothetical protein BP5796_07168 [Coleophoma crateriformis]|uniref:ABM domain-containing protein n=1 Tax=Coleophoma crateriformis TaxID=565419 RepID=A0A3D8RIE4_9HELO|nr:hypothetical protein BP5796_07168 [Coleophoma crateriformis]